MDFANLCHPTGGYPIAVYEAEVMTGDNRYLCKFPDYSWAIYNVGNNDWDTGAVTQSDTDMRMSGWSRFMDANPVWAMEAKQESNSNECHCDITTLMRYGCVSTKGQRCPNNRG